MVQVTPTGGDLPYSVEECGAYPYSGGTAGAFVDVVGINKVDLKSTAITAEIRGDNQVLANAASLSSVDVAMTINALHILSIQAVAGGAANTTGTGATLVVTLTRSNTDQVKDFKLAALTHSKDATGDAIKVTLNRCQWVSGPDWGMADNAFSTVAVGAKAIGDSTGIIYVIEQDGTYAALA